MAKCAGIKADGGRCGAQAIRETEWCFSHHPDYEQARSKRGSKGGKRGGRGRPVAELGALRDENADIRKRLLEGKLQPGVAAVAIQSLNADARLIGTLLKAKEQEEIVREIEELQRIVGMNRGRSGGYAV